MIQSHGKARYSSDVVVIDLEATCDGPGQFDLATTNIVEIGAARLDGKTLEVTDTFSELIRPRDSSISPFITDMTGITPEMVERCDQFDIVMRQFTDWYGSRNRSILAAYGVYYDIPLLRKECGAFDIPFGKHFVGSALDVRTTALLYLAENGKSTSGLTLEIVLERMGLNHLGLSFHRALDDALAGAAILQYFHRGEVSLPGAEGR